MRDYQTPERVLAAIDAITNTVTMAPNAFNLTASDLAMLADVRDVLSISAEAQRTGALVQAQKVRDKDAALTAASAGLATAAKVALASPANAGQLSRIGLARPAKPVRPTSIPAPTNLVATPVMPARTRLDWSRNAPYGATFEVFGSTDGLAYEFIGTTTKSRLDLESAPGMAAWYKVRAVRGGLASPFSGEASVYAPGFAARPELKVA